MSFCAIDFLDPGSLACRSLGQRFMKQYKTSLFLLPSLCHMETTIFCSFLAVKWKIFDIGLEGKVDAICLGFRIKWH